MFSFNYNKAACFQKILLTETGSANILNLLTNYKYFCDSRTFKNCLIKVYNNNNIIILIATKY